jgi:hypothetical protein
MLYSCVGDVMAGEIEPYDQGGGIPWAPPQTIPRYHGRWQGDPDFSVFSPGRSPVPTWGYDLYQAIDASGCKVILQRERRSPPARSGQAPVDPAAPLTPPQQGEQGPEVVCPKCCKTVTPRPHRRSSSCSSSSSSGLVGGRASFVLVSGSLSHPLWTCNARVRPFTLPFAAHWVPGSETGGKLTPL